MNGLWHNDGTLNLAYRPDYSGCVLPYCQWYQDDFLGGIRGLSASTVGIYTVLLNEMYARGEALRLSQSQMVRMCGSSSPTFKAAIVSLSGDGKLLRLDAGLWNARVEKTFVVRKKEQGTNSRAALLGVKKRNEIHGVSERSLSVRPASAQPSSEAHKEREDDGGGGDSRGPTNPSKSIDPTFRELILEAIGTDRSGLQSRGGSRLGGQTDMFVAKQWATDLGLTETEQLAVIRETMARKTDGPPSSFGFFTKAMQRLAAVKAAPPIETPTFTHTNGLLV